MRTSLRVSVAQLTSSNRHDANIELMKAAAVAAGKDGADLLALPEVSGLMNQDGADAKRHVTWPGDDPYIAACRVQAAEQGIWIHLGSTPVRMSDRRYLNHSVLLDDHGRTRATYDKIHLFDICLDGQDPTGESRRYEAGDEAVLVDTPWGLWGLSVCYDLRFPYLYRDYCLNGATVVFVPSAFTVPTGHAHWEVLLRARAIENGVWVIASAQVGRHADGRTTYGHSVVIDPWGKIDLDLGGNRPAQATVDIDLEKVAWARSQIPSLRNGRAYSFRRVERPREAIEDVTGSSSH